MISIKQDDQISFNANSNAYIDNSFAGQTAGLNKWYLGYFYIPADSNAFITSGISVYGNVSGNLINSSSEEYTATSNNDNLYFFICNEVPTYSSYGEVAYKASKINLFIDQLKGKYIAICIGVSDNDTKPNETNYSCNMYCLLTKFIQQSPGKAIRFTTNYEIQTGEIHEEASPELLFSSSDYGIHGLGFIENNSNISISTAQVVRANTFTECLPCDLSDLHSVEIPLISTTKNVLSNISKGLKFTITSGSRSGYTEIIEPLQDYMTSTNSANILKKFYLMAGETFSLVPVDVDTGCVLSMNGSSGTSLTGLTMGESNLALTFTYSQYNYYVGAVNYTNSSAAYLSGTQTLTLINSPIHGRSSNLFSKTYSSENSYIASRTVYYGEEVYLTMPYLTTGSGISCDGGYGGKKVILGAGTNRIPRFFQYQNYGVSEYRNLGSNVYTEADDRNQCLVYAVRYSGAGNPTLTITGLDSTYSMYYRVQTSSFAYSPSLSGFSNTSGITTFSSYAVDSIINVKALAAKETLPSQYQKCLGPCTGYKGNSGGPSYAGFSNTVKLYGDLAIGYINSLIIIPTL